LGYLAISFFGSFDHNMQPCYTAYSAYYQIRGNGKRQ